MHRVTLNIFEHVSFVWLFVRVDLRCGRSWPHILELSFFVDLCLSLVGFCEYLHWTRTISCIQFVACIHGDGKSKCVARRAILLDHLCRIPWACDTFSFFVFVEGSSLPRLGFIVPFEDFCINRSGNSDFATIFQLRDPCLVCLAQACASVGRCFARA